MNSLTRRNLTALVAAVVTVGCSTITNGRFDQILVLSDPPREVVQLEFEGGRLSEGVDRDDIAAEVDRGAVGGNPQVGVDSPEILSMVMPQAPTGDASRKKLIYIFLDPPESKTSPVAPVRPLEFRHSSKPGGDPDWPNWFDSAVILLAQLVFLPGCLLNGCELWLLDDEPGGFSGPPSEPYLTRSEMLYRDKMIAFVEAENRRENSQEYLRLREIQSKFVARSGPGSRDRDRDRNPRY